MNKRIIAPIIGIAAMTVLAVSTTYAMFTKNFSKSIDVTSGKIDVSLNMTMSSALSRYNDTTPFDAMANAVTLGGEHDAVFELTGTGDLSDSSLTLDRIAPTDQVTTSVSATNASNISIKWRYGITLTGDLVPALSVKFGTQAISTASAGTIYGKWSGLVEPTTTQLLAATDLVVTFPSNPETNNDYYNKTGSVKVFIETVQGNMTVTDPKVTTFGFADSYKATVNSQEVWVHEISSVEQFRNIGVFSYKADDFKTEYGITEDSFCNKNTIYKLIDDIDCDGVSPWYDSTNSVYYDLDEGTDVHTIGDFVFTGVLDGNGHKISNMTVTEKMGDKVSGGECDVGGLFDAIFDAEIKNLTLSSVVINNASAKPGAIIACGYPSSLGSANTLKFENVTIDPSCSLTGKQGCAAFVGYARNDASVSFINCVNSANITASGANTGAFLGSNSGGSGRTFVFTNCTNNGDIRANNLVGGFAGTQTNGCTWTFTNCTNNGDIYGSAATNIGMFMGQKSGSDTVVYVGTNTNSGSIRVPSANIASARNNSYEFKNEDVPTNIHYSGEPENATKANLGDMFVIANDIPALSIGFNSTTKVVEIGNSAGITYDSVLVDVSLGPVDKFSCADSHMLSSGGDNVASQIKSSISELTLKEVTRVGWIKPTAETPTGTYQDTGTIKAKEAYECYLIPFAEVDNPSYSDGYHEDATGGYYVVNNKGQTETFAQIFSIWLTATWRVYLYNGSTVVGFGQWSSPVGVGGAQTYFSNIYSA